MDLQQIQTAKTVHDLTQQITDMQTVVNNTQAQLDALGLTADQITAALALYDSIQQVLTP